MTLRLITTSWDDGDPRDLRMADLLEKYGLKGTFYACPTPPCGPPLTSAELSALSRRFEVGAHTIHHVVLTEVPAAQAREEISASRKYVQDATGGSVEMFCFPRGRYSRALGDLVAAEGFAAGRTTDAFRSSAPLDGPLLHVTQQAYPHSRTTHLLHALRHGNWIGMASYSSHLLRNRWTTIALRSLEEVARNGGIWHLWGHSWEIDSHGLWGELETLFRAAAALKDVAPVTNGQLVRMLRGSA
jgi:peptidoglycan/xylan/chitin deacetylase (PgdA/CDA1 family)